MKDNECESCAQDVPRGTRRIPCQEISCNGTVCGQFDCVLDRTTGFCTWCLDRLCYKTCEECFVSFESKIKRITCEQCDEEPPYDICQDCLNKGELTRCNTCSMSMNSECEFCNDNRRTCARCQEIVCEGCLGDRMLILCKTCVHLK